MQLVERHRIDRHDARFVAIDAAAFASKNLYNAALYITRQAFIFEGKRIAYEALARQLQGTERYRTLPAKVAQWVLKQVTRAWDSFFLALTAWKADPASFLGRPRFPKYLDKNGRNLLIYTIQAISRQALRRGIIQPSGLSIRIQTNQTAVRQVRIIPRGTHYMIEIVYEQPINPASLDSSLFAAVDIGLNNLAALTSNKLGFQPCLINGRPLKTVNQWYNKRRAYLQARLSQKRQSSRQLDALTDKRNRRITDYLHNASRALINVLIREKIGSLVIGKNDGW